MGGDRAVGDMEDTEAMGSHDVCGNGPITRRKGYYWLVIGPCVRFVLEVPRWPFEALFFKIKLSRTNQAEEKCVCEFTSFLHYRCGNIQHAYMETYLMEIRAVARFQDDPQTNIKLDRFMFF